MKILNIYEEETISLVYINCDCFLYYNINKNCGPNLEPWGTPF